MDTTSTIAHIEATLGRLEQEISILRKLVNEAKHIQTRSKSQNVPPNETPLVSIGQGDLRRDYYPEDV